jgi:exosortase/archaeosortase family protein
MHMLKKIRDIIHGLLTGPEYQKIRYIFLFLIITLMIHFFWRFWERQIFYFPIGNWMTSAVRYTTVALFHQNSWIVDHIFHIHFRSEQPVIWFDNTWGIGVYAGCSGFKQIAQFMLLILFFPGSWTNKTWFIPAGMLVVYLTNIFRLVVVSLLLNYHPSYAHFAHDYILRSLFYVVIFILWLLWINKFGGKKIRGVQNPA